MSGSRVKAVLSASLVALSVVAGDVGRIGQRICPMSGVGGIRENVGPGESEASEFAIEQRKHRPCGELAPNRMRDDRIFGEMLWRIALLGLHLDPGQVPLRRACGRASCRRPARRRCPRR